MRRNDDQDLLTHVIMLALIAVLWILTSLIGKIVDAKNWNDGYHECGGQWVYQQAIGHYYTTNYLYECDKCGKTQEFSNQRHEK